MNNRSLVLILLGATVACNRSPEPAASGPPKEAHEHGHGAGGMTPSDLDRPVEALVAASCEHQKKTFECDECRHEVGFVRAPASLVKEGLLKLTRAERRKVAVGITLTGEVRFDERRIGHVSSQVEGVIKQVHVALGDAIKKGQPLLEIESVAVGQGQASYLEAAGLATLAQRSFERVSALRQEGIASEKEYLQAKQDLEAARIRTGGAYGKLDRLGATGNASGRVVLRAPLDGVVLVMHAVPGEVARAEKSLLTLGDATAVWVWADLYEKDIAAVKQGQAVARLAASIAVKAYPGQEFPGVVDLISPAMDESSRTVKVRVEVKNADGRLLAGMFAAVKLFLPGNDEALVLPRSAVLEDEGRSFVFVHHRGDDYVRRPVVVGRSWAGWVEIRKGLTTTPTVVAEGAFLLKSDVLRKKMGAGCAD